MPVFRTGNMWEALARVDYFIVTTNAIVKQNGAVVMGRGIAKEMRDKFPGVDKAIGKAIREKGQDYGLILGKKVGA